MKLTHLFIILLLLAGCTDTETKIGIIAATSGPAAFMGTPQVAGAQLAVNELRAEGVDIQLVIEDSPCDPTKAVSAFQKLSTVDQVDYIIGPSCSFENMAVAPLADQVGIPVFALGAQEELATAGTHTIPINNLPHHQGKLLAQEARNQGFTTAGSIYFLAPYTKQLSQGFAEEFGNHVLDESLTNFAQSSFKTELAKAMDRNIDVLYVEPFGQEETFIKEAIELGYQGAIVFGENGFRDDVRSLPGTIFVAYQDLSAGSYDMFHKKFQATYDRDPIQPFGAAMAYDAVYLIADNLDVEHEIIKNKIISETHVGASGMLRFERGQPMRDMLIYEVQNGSFVE